MDEFKTLVPAVIKQEPDALEESERTIAILRDKQTHHESTLVETMRVRDTLRAKLDTAVEALEKIEAYFCACSDDGEIVPQIEAREALDKINQGQQKLVIREGE